MSGDVERKIAWAVRAAVDARDPASIAAALHVVQPDELQVFFHARLVADDGTTLSDGTNTADL